MRKVMITIVSAIVWIGFAAQSAHADLEGFLSGLNKQARADIKHFNSTLSSQFKIPVPNVEAILKTVKDPADAFMCFQLSQMTGIPVEDVVTTYKKNSGQGWGVIAKRLGIKPGSDAFHALKQGDFVFEGNQEKKQTKGKGKSKGKKKGKKNK